MKQRLQGLIAGVVIGATVTGGAVFASTGAKNIEAFYNNIKIYKNNVLCEVKDSNGTVVEPFIADGTTYLPVRGVANLAGMDVSWDGATQSVYLWEKTPQVGTTFLEECPPYMTGGWFETYLQSEGKLLFAGTEKCTNGFTLTDCGFPNCDCEDFAIFNLKGRYSEIDFTVGNTRESGQKLTGVSFFVDGCLVEEVVIEEGDMSSKKVTIPVSGASEMKIKIVDIAIGGRPSVGFGDIVAR